jgi:hypothetical protein
MHVGRLKRYGRLVFAQVYLSGKLGIFKGTDSEPEMRVDSSENTFLENSSPCSFRKITIPKQEKSGGWVGRSGSVDPHPDLRRFFS